MLHALAISPLVEAAAISSSSGREGFEFGLELAELRVVGGRFVYSLTEKWLQNRSKPVQKVSFNGIVCESMRSRKKKRIW